MADQPIVAIAIAEFDITSGNTLTEIYPKDVEFPQNEPNLADLALPDGSHITSEDHTYIAIKRSKERRIFDFPSTKKSDVSEEIIYGLSMFINLPDPKAKRGAIQKAMLLLSRSPCFDIYEPILREAIHKYVETNDVTVLKQVYDALNTNWKKKETFKWNDKTFSLIVPPTVSGVDLPGANLTQLITRFGVDTMYIWYGLLLENRILFFGQPAKDVGNCCISAPLLVAPLKSYAGLIFPYVSLTDITPVQQKQYICATTNAVFETKTEWYDMMASFSVGVVKKRSLKLSSMDKEFITNVISGIQLQKGEKWVRHQFYNYTKGFLEEVENEEFLCDEHEELAPTFKTSQSYHSWRKMKYADEDEPSETKAMQALNALKLGGATLSDLKKKQHVWDLLQNMIDLKTINQVIENNAVAVVGPLLRDNSAQVRKYAAAIVAQLAISLKGQLQLVQLTFANPNESKSEKVNGDSPVRRNSSVPQISLSKDKLVANGNSLIATVIQMLQDPMPNVVSAACYCLFKLSALAVGVSALVQHNGHEALKNLICSQAEDNLMIKIRAAQTLLQIYKLDPSCAKVGADELKLELFTAQDKQLKANLLLLLDLWEELQAIDIMQSDKAKAHMKALVAPPTAEHPISGDTLRDLTAATSYLLSDCASNPHVMLELAAAGGVDTLVQNISLANPEEPLARQSWSCLSLMADTNLGRTTIIEQKAIALAIEELAIQDNSPTKHMYVYNVCRFLEVCSQHVNSAIQVVKNGGIHRLIKAVDRFYQQNAVPICLPCLGAIKWCFVFVPQDQRLEHVDSMRFNPLRAIYNKLLRDKELQAAQTEIFELLQVVLYLVDEEDLRTSPRRPTTATVEKTKRPSIKNERRKSQANVRAAVKKRDSISNLLDEVTQTLTDIPPANAKPVKDESLAKSSSLVSMDTPPATTTTSMKHSASVGATALSSKEAKKQRELEKEQEKKLAKEEKDKKRRTSASPMPTISPAEIKKFKRGSAEKPLKTVEEEPSAPTVSRAKALADIKKSRRHTDRAVPRANLSRKTDITPGSLGPIPLLKPRAFDDQSKPRSLTNSSESNTMGDSLGPVISTFPLPRPNRNIVAEFINTPVTTVPSAMDARPEMKTTIDSKQLLNDLMDEISNL